MSALGIAFQIGAAFNLVCTGTQTTGPLLDLDHQFKSNVSVTFRVDLAKMRWCSQDCISTLPLVEVIDTRIVFEKVKDKDGDILMFADRETGALFDRTRSFLINRIVLTQGSCERAPFTGFPVRKF